MSPAAATVAPPQAAVEELAGHPLRPPDWRWQVVTRFPAAVCEAVPDLWLQRAARWRAAGCRSSEDPALHSARALADSDPGSPRRAELESRLLAGQRPATIRARMLIAPDVTTACHALWFDVSDRRADGAFIHRWILDIRRLREGRSLPLGWLWRAAAYVAGPRLLEELLHAARQLTPAQRAAGVAGYLDPAAHTADGLREWIARCVPAPPLQAEPLGTGPLADHARQCGVDGTDLED